jgi:prepilin-type N-terminal cleavage/methylation domain-containing protein
MFYNHLKSAKFNSGLTLVEILLAVVIFSFLTLAAFSLISDYNKTTNLLTSQLALQNDGRNSLSQIVNDLRRINRGSNGAFAIDSATADSFIFYSNIDDDSYFEKVEYFISGNELKKSVIKPSGSPLVYDPANEITTVLSNKNANGATALFSYYDSTYAGTGAALALPVDITVIRFIKIDLVLDDKPLAPVAPLTMEAKVTLRNLKDN